ncbi:hypothetical protein DdX_03245 [Ditylenchus destructor]|uniref:Uncharacterized protein n=1 Tax=Ditylenchus destructor TaxID=166010 RepID=A0AAD4NG97_9BILA|nr:hypothetical protein DdX_03245 [Ditylenchus destructor]
MPSSVSVCPPPSAVRLGCSGDEPREKLTSRPTYYWKEASKKIPDFGESCPPLSFSYCKQCSQPDSYCIANIMPHSIASEKLCGYYARFGFLFHFGNTAMLPPYISFYEATIRYSSFSVI